MKYYVRIELGFEYNYILLFFEIYLNFFDMFKKKNLDINVKKRIFSFSVVGNIFNFYKCRLRNVMFINLLYI